MTSTTIVQVENKIERNLRIFRGVVLKQDLKNTVQAPSMKELRKDIEKLCENSESAKKTYQGFEKKQHVSLEFAKLLIIHLYQQDCKIILIT